MSRSERGEEVLAAAEKGVAAATLARRLKTAFWAIAALADELGVRLKDMPGAEPALPAPPSPPTPKPTQIMREIIPLSDEGPKINTVVPGGDPWATIRYRPDWGALTRDERMKFIRPLVEKGLTSGQIAEHFQNCTRSSILGYLHRHGAAEGLALSGLSGTPRRERSTVPRAPRVAAPHVPRAKPARIEKVAIPRPEPVEVPVLGTIGFMEITTTRCKYPLWDHQAFPTLDEMRFCGEEVSPESAKLNRHYCRRHLWLCHQVGPRPGPKSKVVAA